MWSRRLSVVVYFCLLLLSSFSFLPLSSTHQVPTIKGDIVYINDSQAFISLSPHTIVESSYVYLNVTSKVFTGQIDIMFGFDRTRVKPKSFELYNPRLVTKSRDLSARWDNPLYKINYTYSSFENPWAYDGTIWVWQNKTFGGLNDDGEDPLHWRWVLKWEQDFEQANVNTKIVYWQEQETWQNLLAKVELKIVNYNFQGMDKWFFANASVTENIEYHLRVWIQITPALGMKNTKYFIAFKRQSDTLHDAVENNRFYFIDPWWNNSWDYRKLHQMINKTGAGTDYQIRIVAHYGSGSDSGKNVYLNSHSQTDFDDLRFVDDNDTTELDYWLQKKTDSANATFWVEIRDDLSSSNVTFYIYYGNDAVSTISNGANTFQLFDHFDDSSLNLTLWDESGRGNYTESGTFLNISGWDGQGGKVAETIDSDANFSQTIRMMYRFKFYQQAGGIYDHAGLRNDDVDFAMASSYNNVKRAWNQKNSAGADIQVITLPLIHYFWILDLQVNASIVRYDFEDSNNYSSTSSIPDSSMSIRFQGDKDSVQHEVVIDWVFIAKYVSPEPIHGYWGNESARLVYLRFYINTGGILRIDNGTVANTTLNVYNNGSTLELVAIVEGNLTYGFANFTYDSTANISNPFNLTPTSNLTVWTYFGQITAGVAGNTTGWTLALWGIGAIICVTLGTIFFTRWKR